MISTPCFFTILHVAICMPFQWLTGNNHKLAHQNWSAKSMGRAIDILPTACNDFIDDQRLIHYKSFMMNIYYPLMDELPEFKDYMDYQCEDRTSNYSVSSNTREVPLKKLIKGIFTFTDRDNKYSTNFL